MKIRTLLTAAMMAFTLAFPACASEIGPEDTEVKTSSASSDVDIVQDNSTSDEKETGKSYTDEDLYLMAHLLAGEMQNCPDTDQLYTGSVVLNRVNSPAFPNTIREVIFQKGQYQCTRDGNFYREPTERNWENARILLEGGSVLPDALFQAGIKLGKHIVAHTKNAWYTY